MYKRVCEGGLANESIFAIILYGLKQLEHVKNEISHATDWTKMTSPTSPYVFKHGTTDDIQFINTFLENHKYTMFLRKVDASFPDEILTEFIQRPLYLPPSTTSAFIIYFTQSPLILFGLLVCFCLSIYFF